MSGIAVELSSTTTSPGEPVQVTIRVPKKLAGESMAILAVGDDGTLSVVLPEVPVGEDLIAYATVNMGQTTTLRAVVPKKALTDEATWPPDAKTLGQSEDFTITVE